MTGVQTCALPIWWLQKEFSIWVLAIFSKTYFHSYLLKTFYPHAFFGEHVSLYFTWWWALLIYFTPSYFHLVWKPFLVCGKDTLGSMPIIILRLWWCLNVHHVICIFSCRVLFCLTHIYVRLSLVLSHILYWYLLLLLNHRFIPSAMPRFILCSLALALCFEQ